jgi:hypothetical protein
MGGRGGVRLGQGGKNLSSPQRTGEALEAARASPRVRIRRSHGGRRWVLASATTGRRGAAHVAAARRGRQRPDPNPGGEAAGARSRPTVAGVRRATPGGAVHPHHRHPPGGVPQLGPAGAGGGAGARRARGTCPWRQPLPLAPPLPPRPRASVVQIPGWTAPPPSARRLAVCLTSRVMPPFLGRPSGSCPRFRVESRYNLHTSCPKRTFYREPGLAGGGSVPHSGA